MKNINQVRLLRERITIGYMEARQLLQEHKCDIEKTVSFLEQKYVAAVAATTKLSDDIILPVLLRNKYDTAQAISHLEEAYRLIDGIPQTETIYTLHRWQFHKKHAVDTIAGSLQQSIQINRQDNQRYHPHNFSWYIEEQLRGLDSVHRCVIALTDWLDYGYCEGFSYAINYYPDLMAEQLQVLALPGLAAALKFAWQISEETRKKYKSDSLENFVAYSNAFQLDKDYKQVEHYFAANQYLITERLFAFIKTHADQFP